MKLENIKKKIKATGKHAHTFLPNEFDPHPVAYNLILTPEKLRLPHTRIYTRLCVYKFYRYEYTSHSHTHT